MSALFPETIETERLRLRRLHPQSVDVFDLYEICSSDPGIEDVTEHVVWEPHETVKETHDFVAQAVQAWDEGERAPYVIRPLDGEDGAGDIAGTTELGPDWERDTAELGIWLRKRFWGRGYAGERAAALIEMAFERLDLSLVEVSHLDGNEQSRRAIESYVEAHGGGHDGLLRNFQANADGSVVDVHRFTVTQEEYREATRE